MRSLTEEETKTLFQKLAHYTGRSLNQLIQPTEEDERYVFRIQGSRVYYVKLSIANLATSIARDNLLSLGTCIGKFTRTMKFRMHITAYVFNLFFQYWAGANRMMEQARCDCPSRAIQGVDSSQWRDALFIRRPCPQGAYAAVVGGLSGEQRMRGVFSG